MSTTISKLYLNGEQFLPMTACEAVIVNGDDLAGLNLKGVTTLDKVLEALRQLVGTNALNIEDVQSAISILKKNYTQISAGDGIEITTQTLSDGSTKLVITNTGGNSSNTQLFEIITTELPTAGENYTNKIYLIPSTSDIENNSCDEYVCVLNNSGTYVWERIGSVSIETSINTAIANLETKIASLTSSQVTAKPVYKSDNTTLVVIDYDIPSTLYD